jgi:hypothetical protein
MEYIAFDAHKRYTLASVVRPDEKVPFGKVEAINGNIRAMLRRGRGYRDHEYLLLKVQRATATRRLRQAA